MDAPAGPPMLSGTELTAVPDERQQLSITVDTRTNSLLVSGTPTYLDLVEKVVTELDDKEANEREVFGRPIGMNQGVAFPLAKAYANLEAANLMRWKAANLFDAGESCAAEANMSKMLASEASWEAGNAAVQTFGGFGFAEEYDIERKFREARLYQVAPINNNLVLAFVAQKCLGLPKSY